MTTHANDRYSALCLIAALGLSSLACSDTLTVCSSGCDYADLQSAIDDASDGDVIEIAAGTYVPVTTIDTLGKAITLQGEVDSSGDPTTIISGDTDSDGVGDIRVFICELGETNATVFENLVIRDGNGQSFHGAGLYLDGASPMIRNCHFLDNRWDYDPLMNGGAIWARNGSYPTIEECYFARNGAAFGGAIYGSAEIRNSTFYENEVTDEGPALYMGPFDVSYCRFERNSQTNSLISPENTSGAVSARDSTFEHCDFIENSSSAGAGALSISGDSVLSNCLFEDTVGGPGLFVSSAAPLVVTNCTFTGNERFGIEHSLDTSPEFMVFQLSDSLVCGNTVGQIDFADLSHHDWDFGGNCISDLCDGDGDGIPDCIDECTYYPAPYTCSDSGQTIYVPVGASIQDAIHMVPEHGTVHLLGGVHRIERPIEVYEKVVDLVGETGSVLSGDVDGDGIADGEILWLMDVYARMNVRNLHFVDGLSSNWGGAVYVDFAIVTFEDCVFERNSANLGGAVYLFDSTEVEFYSCTFNGNEALEDGGAVYSWGSIDLMDDGIFRDNVSGRSGGAVFIRGESQPEFSQCRFQENRAAEDGGAVAVQDAAELLIDWITFSDCWFVKNIARYGGALANRRHAGLFNSVSLEGCTVDENTADFGGGVFTGEMAGTQLLGSRVRKNHATSGLGGGLEAAPLLGWHTVENTEFCGNTPEHIRGGWVDNGGNSFLFMCVEHAPGDFNRDGWIDGADLAYLLGTWGDCDGSQDESCEADINDDGQVNGADLAALLGAWGEAGEGQ